MELQSTGGKRAAPQVAGEKAQLSAETMRAQVEVSLELLKNQIVDKVMNDRGTLDKPIKQLGVHVKEVPVWGLDCFTRKNVEIVLQEMGWERTQVRRFIEALLLPHINMQNGPEAFTLRAALESIKCSKSCSEKDQIGCEGLLKALSFFREPVNFHVHPKGTGVICLEEGGIPAHTFVSPYLGELYPVWRWCQKLDAIEDAQRKYGLKPTLPDFYNIVLERPRLDEKGYGLLFVEAGGHVANFSSSLSHSCDANCSTSVVAKNGKLFIALTTIKDVAHGEELTMDYNSVTTEEIEYRAAVCLCGKTSCRGSFLHFSGQASFQVVLKDFGALNTFRNLIQVATPTPLSEEEQMVLGTHGFKSAALGEYCPPWLAKIAALQLRYIEMERKKLPLALMQMKKEELNGYQYNHKSADCEARALMEQRVQSLISIIGAIYHVLTKQNDHGTAIDGPATAEVEPPLRLMSESEMVESVWNGPKSVAKRLTKALEACYANKPQPAAVQEHIPAGSTGVGPPSQAPPTYPTEQLQDLSSPLEYGPNPNLASAAAAAAALSTVEANAERSQQSQVQVQFENEQASALAGEEVLRTKRARKANTMLAGGDFLAQPPQRQNSGQVLYAHAGEKRSREEETYAPVCSGNGLGGLTFQELDALVSAGNQNDRIVIWDIRSHRVVSGNSAPMRKSLKAILAKKPWYEILNGQDVEYRRMKKQKGASPSFAYRPMIQQRSRTQTMQEWEKAQRILVNIRALVAQNMSRKDALRKALLQLRALVLKLDATPEARHVAAADALLLLAYTRNLCTATQYKRVVAEPVKVRARDLGVKVPASVQARFLKEQGLSADGVVAAMAQTVAAPSTSSTAAAAPGAQGTPNTQGTPCGEAAGNQAASNAVRELPEQKDEPEPLPEEEEEKDERMAEVEAAVARGSPNDRFFSWHPVKQEKSRRSWPLRDALKYFTRHPEMVLFTDQKNPRKAAAQRAAAQQAAAAAAAAKQTWLRGDEVIHSFKRVYSPAYILAQLLHWHNDGHATDVNKAVKDELLGCVEVPDPARAYIGTAWYGESQRLALAAHLEDPTLRKHPFPAEVARAFPTNGSSEAIGEAIYGSPSLDCLLGDLYGLPLVIHALRRESAGGEIEGTEIAELDPGNRLRVSGIVPVRMEEDLPDGAQAPACSWVQCENPRCLKWRRLPFYININKELDQDQSFTCKDNKWVPEQASCDVPEDEWREEEATTGCVSTWTGGAIEEKDFRVGRWLDVFDLKTNQWTPARVLVNQPHEVLVHFYRQPDIYDETVLKSSGCLAKLHSRSNRVSETAAWMEIVRQEEVEDEAQARAMQLNASLHHQGQQQQEQPQQPQRQEEGQLADSPVTVTASGSTTAQQDGGAKEPATVSDGGAPALPDQAVGSDSKGLTEIVGTRTGVGAGAAVIGVESAASAATYQGELGGEGNSPAAPAPAPVPTPTPAAGTPVVTPVEAAASTSTSNVVAEVAESAPAGFAASISDMVAAGFTSEHAGWEQ
ncbi:unnamed protein product [Chrysoparadoxa australica]